MKFYRINQVIGIILLSVSYSCDKSSLPVINEINPVVENNESEPVNSQTITIEVSFAAAPLNPTVTITPLKYNKTSVINFEFDDNPAEAYTLYQYFNTQTYSNGTGKDITYRAGIAVNSKGNYNNGDLWENYQGNLTKQQSIEIISGGWTLENHGYYHSVLNSNDNFGYGKSISLNISDNTKHVFDKTGFKMRTLVVPSNDPGYLLPAFEQGLIATTSTNHFEGFQSFPLYGDYVNIATLPGNNIHLRRDFNDKWDITGINSIKAKLTTLFNKSNTNERMLYRLGTHLPNLDAFKILSEHIKNTSNDKAWITSMQEMIEYLQLRDKIIKNQTFENGKLFITLDTSKVDKETLFREVTLMINSTSPVQTIKVYNARDYSSNLNGLVNISF